MHQILNSLNQGRTSPSSKLQIKCSHTIEHGQNRKQRCLSVNSNSSSHLVKITPSLGGDEPPTLGININDAHLLQLLQDVTWNGTTALAEVWWAGAIPLAATIDLLESTYTNALPEVDLPCNWGSPGVVPVRVIRRKLLEPRSLHNVNPLRELHLTEGKEKLLHIATQGFSHYPWKETNVKEKKTKSSFPIATN